MKKVNQDQHVVLEPYFFYKVRYELEYMNSYLPLQ